MPALSPVNVAAVVTIALAIVVSVDVVVLVIDVVVTVVIVDAPLVALVFSMSTVGASKTRPPGDRWST